MSMVKKGSINKIAIFTVGLILFAFIFLPILWMILTSVKSELDIHDVTMIFKPTLDNWKAVLFRADFLNHYGNSLIICAGTVPLVMLVGMMAAYALSRYNFKSKENIAFMILSQRMMPVAVMVLPIYVIYSKVFHFQNTYHGLIFVYTVFNLPLAIWMLRGFIESIPRPLEEAAIVDGCSRAGAFIRVGIPLISGGLMATAAIVFLFTINEFFFAFLLSGSDTMPISVLVTRFLPTGTIGMRYGEAAAAGFMIMLPGVIFALAVQKYLIQGMSFGVIKG